MNRALLFLALAVMPALAQDDIKASADRGKMLYMQTCMACHQLTVLGIPGAFPPLAKTDYVTGDTRRLVAITLKGISGAMTVDGKIYATGMPQPDLTITIGSEKNYWLYRHSTQLFQKLFNTFNDILLLFLR